MDFSFLADYKGFFIRGTQITILLAFFAVLFGILIGIVLAMFKISSNKFLKGIASVYIEFIRGTPLLVQLFIIYYGLPYLGIEFPDFPLFGQNVGDFMAGVIAMSVNSGAYVAEIFRAGIQAVDKGQMEAARSLGMPYLMSMKKIILPQAFKNILPALGNEFIVVIKESAIVSIIGIHDLMYNADTVRGNTFKPFAPLIVAAVIYFVITFTLSKFVGLLEKRMDTE
ncbi:amino acid ABC transporter membrane protein (PAAT family) [Halanaerobium saccharolyticum]|uniref:Amino acid ABC transporter membrane protein (PAAT family) n=1 Tax=Halanaerobium saccharolyticum TaxID=43595 RepID=A0A4V3G4S9_9FIRM|nr:amino acid ABC transporter permease [Halanaerobium saccharolyticum]RAK06922.1 amino acid ABC transporter membrane protein (PAAT family) [Halanaerobium saccharolyticum]TDW01649.1 amino acid ABC transporter membrane protein (PAAT family) [Halanaerobium saccharolyticum]TDX53047.1 amino acid ABC transporter membrane protein (PAAT family) [Halanaerobium saccharolyticum]